MLTTTDPANRVTTVGYDSAGQTKSASYSDGATPTTTFGYDPTGRRVSMTDGTGSSTWSYNTFGELTGQYTDAETGFVQPRARYYDPATATFLTVDPKVDSTHSAYGYVAGNPLNGTDLSGLCWSGFGWACTAASAVGGAVATAANWTWENRGWENRGWIEVGLAVASLAIPVVGVGAWAVIAGESAFWAGTALTAADTANACWNGQGSSCSLGAVSLFTGGAGYGMGHIGGNFGKVAKVSSGFAQFANSAASKFFNGMAWVENSGSLAATVAGACGANVIRDKDAPEPFRHGR